MNETANATFLRRSDRERACPLCRSESCLFDACRQHRPAEHDDAGPPTTTCYFCLYELGRVRDKVRGAPCSSCGVREDNWPDPHQVPPARYYAIADGVPVTPGRIILFTPSDTEALRRRSLPDDITRAIAAKRRKAS